MRNLLITIVVGILAAIIIVLITWLTGAAHAEMIKPTCWEENKDGNTYRHCEVNRPPKPEAPAPRASPQQPLPPQAAAPPPPLPPTQAYRNPDSPYAPGYGYRSTLGPYGPRGGFYGPPPIVFRFGPLGFFIH